MEVKKREDNSQKRARKKFLFVFVFEMGETKIYLNGMRMELIGRKWLIIENKRVVVGS